MVKREQQLQQLLAQRLQQQQALAAVVGATATASKAE
jgi:hypothetical protein